MKCALGIAKQLRLALMLGAFLLNPLALGQDDLLVRKSKWSFQNSGPSQFILKKSPAAEISRSLDANVEILSEGTGLSVSPSFYGAGLVESEALPSSTAMKKLPLSLLRIGSDFHTRYNARTGLMYSAQGTFMKFPNAAEAVAQVRSLGAEPIVQANMFGMVPLEIGGIQKLTWVPPETLAADTVRFLNGERKLGVRYFTTDNEPLSWSIQHADLLKKPLSADELLTRIVKGIVAMRDAQASISGNPYDIEIFGPELSESWNGFQTGASSDCQSLNRESNNFRCQYGNAGQHKNVFEYAVEFFKQAELGNVPLAPGINPKKYRLVDYFSFHAYPSFRTKFDDRNSFYSSGSTNKDLSLYLSSIFMWNTDGVNQIDYSFPHRKINFFKWIDEVFRKNEVKHKVAFTEFGIDAGWLIDYHPLLRPLYNAEMAALAATNGVHVFILSYLNNGEVLQNHWAMVTQGNKKNPSYYSYSLLAQHFRGEVLKVNVKHSKDDKNAIGAYATRDSETVHVLLFNRSLQEQCIAVSFKENSSVASRMVSHCLPAFSMVLLNIPLSQQQIHVAAFQYGSEELKVVARTPTEARLNKKRPPLPSAVHKKE